MDVIVIGIYSEQDVQKINEAVSLSNNLKIIWEYTQYKLESGQGIKEMLRFFNLYKAGILIGKAESVIASYSLINEVSLYYEATEWQQKEYATPSLFNFFEQIKKVNLKRFIIAFANEWSKDTTVRLEKIELNKLSQRLNTFYVWCEEYRNLTNNSVIRDDYHPLILDVGQ